jgi:menaquinone-9 beta-reductase
VVDQQFCSPLHRRRRGHPLPGAPRAVHLRRSTSTGSLIITREEEFTTPSVMSAAIYGFSKMGLPGYAWYVPKAGGILNVGIGGSAARLKAKGQTLNEHWLRLIEKLNREMAW